MKKTLLFGLIAASLGFTACSSEDDAILGNNTQKKGMVLNATVEQPAETRATINNSAANWQFAFAENDEIKVTNSDISGTYYTFTSNGTTFSSSDAETTATAADWFAYYPSNSIDLTDQAGTLASVANLYALAGATSSATTGAEGLTISMSAKVAILKIENYKESAINIQVKTSADNYVTGLTAKSGVVGFDVTTSTTPTTLFTTSTTGDYYVAVPAGVQLSVKDGNTTIKSTVSTGLTAGNYYTLSIGVPLTLTALVDNSTVKISYSDFQYRTTGQTEWTDYTSESDITVNTNEYVQFRGKPSSTRTLVKTKFVMTEGSFNASGNVMSLLYGHEMEDYAFQDLFNRCDRLKSASELLLPAATLTKNCYSNMFYGCTNLTAAPALPAENLADYCYSFMFDNCDSLKNAPTLPAENLADHCYSYMFNNCDSLKNAPTLSANTLTNGCYEYMFQNCTNLKDAPALPAENLASSCYSNMFRGCKSLKNAPALTANTLTNGCYNTMFRDCTSLTEAPALPATTLASSCYNSMFWGCTKLTTAPTLPATTLADYCYKSMFRGCTKLESVTVNFTSWTSGTDATDQWLYNAGKDASDTPTFNCPAGLDTTTRDNSHVPQSWDVNP